jgi:hypothetical protein
MLRITLNPGSRERLLAAFKAKGPRIASVLQSKLTALMFQLSAFVVSKKLSGEVLKRRTGILAGSVHAVPATFQGTSMVGSVQAAEGPAFYGRIHEYGGSGAYPIIATKARALAFMSHGKQVFAKSVMHPAAMARAFMSTSLAENAANIREQLQSALDAEMDKP